MAFYYGKKNKKDNNDPPFGEKGDLPDVTSQLETVVTNIQSVKANIEKERVSAQKTLNEVEGNYRDIVSQLQSQIEKIKKEKEETEEKLTKERAETEATIKTMKWNLETADRYHTLKVDRIRAEYEDLISVKDAANEQLLIGLTALTTALALDGKPNVSDISDPNRPQKLGEQLGSLYDDQWTDASEELEKLDTFKDDERAIVITLLELLKNVYNHCKEASDSQLAMIEEHIFLPPLDNATPSSPYTNGTDTSSVQSQTSKSAIKIPRLSGRECFKIKGGKVPDLPVEVRKGIKEYRKMVAKQVIPLLEKEIFWKLRKRTDFGEAVVDACIPFISRTVEICWRMCVQDPPMCLKWDIPSDNKFDTDRYRAYTFSGSQIDFVVWPIIYLHDGGSILMKGVAEGKKS